MLRLEIAEEYHGKRVDVALASLAGESRACIQRLIGQGCVYLENVATKIKPRDTAKAGEIYLIDIPKPMPSTLVPEDIPLEILYQDKNIAIINKPAGLVVHPAAGNYTGTLVQGLLYHIKDLSGIGGELRPGIVHRLDKMTSGLMVVAKNDEAHRSLSAQLTDRTCTREYMALARGAMGKNEGRIDAPIGRHHIYRQKMAVTDLGRPAVTDFIILQRMQNACLLHCKLQTGRTHQIRVHLAHIGHPVLDDPVYGGAVEGARQMLHAWRLIFKHPNGGKTMAFEAQPPEDFLRRLRGLGGCDIIQ
ncbi:MAG: RluA family pseudouridine synthase [Clostridia bacterium]|nr:RluA family pseudouridine synthase [Clostridia bacterium]